MGGVSGAWGAVHAGLGVRAGGRGAGGYVRGYGSSPACSSGTAVLAPTFVSSGVGGKATAQFAPVNVQVVSGSGLTNGAVNGKGNLVVGYDESPGSQTGSHNLVLGDHQAYTSYGSLVGGTGNTVSGRDSAVLAQNNTASGAYANITGGRFSTASGQYSAVQGGYQTAPCLPIAQSLAAAPTAPGAGAWAAFLASVTPRLLSRKSPVSRPTRPPLTTRQSPVDSSNLAGDRFRSITGGCETRPAAGRSRRWLAPRPGARQSREGANHAWATCPWSAQARPTPLRPSSDRSPVRRANLATGRFSAVGGGEVNVAMESEVGGGCDNLTGTGPANTNSCDAFFGSPGEALLGGASQSLTTTDSTYPAGP